MFHTKPQIGIILGVIAAANNLSQHLGTNHEVSVPGQIRSKWYLPTWLADYPGNTERQPICQYIAWSVQAIVRMSFWRSFQFVPSMNGSHIYQELFLNPDSLLSLYPYASLAACYLSTGMADPGIVRLCTIELLDRLGLLLRRTRANSLS